jgi:hypothetical protein
MAIEIRVNRFSCRVERFRLPAIKERAVPADSNELTPEAICSDDPSPETRARAVSVYSAFSQ